MHTIIHGQHTAHQSPRWPIAIPHTGDAVAYVGECLHQSDGCATIGKGVQLVRDLIEIDADAPHLVIDLGRPDRRFDDADDTRCLAPAAER